MENWKLDLEGGIDREEGFAESVEEGQAKDLKQQ